MKRSKKQEINTSKSYISFSQHINKQEILMYYGNKEHLASSCVVCSKHRIDKINARSIGKGHLNVFMTERFIKRLFPFGIKQKKFRRSHQGCSIKKLFLKILQYLQENICAGVLTFKKVIEKQQHRCFHVNIAKFLRSFLHNTSGQLLLEVESENISQW